MTSSSVGECTFYQIENFNYYLLQIFEKQSEFTWNVFLIKEDISDKYPQKNSLKKAPKKRKISIQKSDIPSKIKFIDLKQSENFMKSININKIKKQHFPRLKFMKN